jgi:antitoxin component YwqK of YwqJK toxin-antitoxin module
MNPPRDQVKSSRRAGRTLAGLALVAVLAAGLWIAHRHAGGHPQAIRETAQRDMIQKEGRWYALGETNRYTGWMLDVYPGGAPLSRVQLADGLLNGLSETWYTNGQPQVREFFKDGVSHGHREKWHPNGARLSEATIVEGKVTGTFRSWYDNGRLSERIEMSRGRPDGTALAYYPSGFLKAETSVRDGQVLDRKSWNDGQRRAALD